MEGNGRRLGWIAIGLGVLALIIALGGRDPHIDWRHYRSYDGPPAAVAPRGEAGPGWTAPRGDVGPQADRSSDYARGYQDGLQAGRRFDGPRHFGLGGFFWPFFLFGGLLKLLFFGLLLLLALKALGRWRGFGGPRGGRPGQGPSEQPGPEKPPYTGETQSL
jgi:hypothetical protein